MRAILFVFLCSSLLTTGCSYFGYYKHEPAVWASPEESARVKFPDSLEGGTRFSGPMLKALEVAMNDFIPPGTKPEAQPTPEARCLARRETYETLVVKASDDLFLVSFFPDFSRCETTGLIILDAGADYAIDGQGRILAKRW